MIDIATYDSSLSNDLGYGVPLLSTAGVIRHSSEDKRLFDEVRLAETV